MKKYLLLLVLGLVFAGCKHDTNDKVPPHQAIEIDAQIGLTKATDSDTQTAGVWENGDQIGMYISNASGYLAPNVLYTYDGTSFSSLVGMYYDSYAKHDIFGYYPYSATAHSADLATTPLLFNVQGDQSNGKNYTNSDLMYTKITDQVPQTGNSPVALVFGHKLSNVRVVLKNINDEPFSGDLPVVKIVNTNRAAKLNLLTGDVEANVATADVNTITMKVKGPYSEGVTLVEYYAIGVPQKMLNGSQLFYVEVMGATYTVTLTADFTFESGKEHMFNITNSGVDLYIGGGEILEWGKGATEIGTGGGDGVRPSKLAFTFTSAVSGIANVKSVELTVDGVVYNSTEAVWDATGSTLKVVYDQGKKWGYELQKVVIKGDGGTEIKTFDNLTKRIEGDPTSDGYDKVINL